MDEHEKGVVQLIELYIADVGRERLIRLCCGRCDKEESEKMAAAIDRVLARLKGQDPWKELYEAERDFEIADREHGEAIRQLVANDFSDESDKHAAEANNRFDAALARLKAARRACGLAGGSAS